MDSPTPMQRNFNFQKVIAAVGALIMVAKFFAYILTGSVAILTDALESIVNVVAGCIGLYALYLSMQPADREHPYGHGKVELISSSIEGTLISVAGVLIIFEALERIILGDFTVRSLDIGLVIVALAALADFAMGYTAIRMGQSSRSMALESSGRHLCSDTYSSVGILIGLGLVYGLSLFGIDAYWLDPAMAMFFGAIIIYTGLKVVYKAFSGIMDTEDKDLIRQVTRCINRIRTDEVIDVHHLRVTIYGPVLHVDAHMVVPGTLTVAETDVLISRFTEETSSMLGNEVDITFMAEPCDPRFCRYCRRGCPDRRDEFTEIKHLHTDAVTDAEPGDDLDHSR